VPTVARVVAAYDLAVGTRVDADYIAVRQIPREWATSDTLTPEDFIPRTGAVLTYAVRQGDPILSTYLAQDKPSPLSWRVSAGRRAITIPVDEINSLSGMLQAGDLLDLYVSFEHQRRQVTAPLLQGVRVLATGRTGTDEDSAASSFSTITLDAGPEDAIKLVAARQAGSITAMLRHHRDKHTVATATSGDLASLLGMVSLPSEKERTVPVLYGDRSPDSETNMMDEGNAPGNAPGDALFKQAPGFFKLAVPEELVSTHRRLQTTPHRTTSQEASLP
jgi:pilus assembly protein CpaB